MLSLSACGSFCMVLLSLVCLTRTTRGFVPMTNGRHTPSAQALSDDLIRDLDLHLVLEQVAAYAVTLRGRRALTTSLVVVEQTAPPAVSSSESSSSSSSSSRARRAQEFARPFRRSQVDLRVARDATEARQSYEWVEQATLLLRTDHCDNHISGNPIVANDRDDDGGIHNLSLPPIYHGVTGDEHDDHDDDGDGDDDDAWPWKLSDATRHAVDTDDDEWMDLPVVDWTLQDVKKAEQIALRLCQVHAWGQSSSSAVATWAPLLAQLVRQIRVEDWQSDLLPQIRDSVDIVRVKTATDPTGRSSYSFVLSATKFPVVGVLRNQIVELEQSSSRLAIFVKDSNKLADLRQALEETEHDITLGLVHAVARHRAALDQGLHCLAQLDVVMAKAAFGVVHGGVLPRVVPQGMIHVCGFLHPLLLQRGNRANEAVPVDLKLGAPEDATSDNRHLQSLPSDASRALIISGPNGGGKTLAMKSFGLVSVLVKLGIPLPVQPTRHQQQRRQSPIVGYFDRVLTALGDRQNVSTGQSTFMAQLSTYARILEQVDGSPAVNGSTISGEEAMMNGENILVLLDELGSGTEAQGGGAIGQAVLEHMLQSRKTCHVVATTHSRRLKALSMEDDSFDCATVLLMGQAGFQRPSYRLEYGLIGESFALEAAARAIPSLPETVIMRATELLQHTTKSNAGDTSENNASMNESTVVDEAYLRALRTSLERQDALSKAARTEAQDFAQEMKKVQASLLNVAQQYERKWNGWQVRLEEVYQRLQAESSSQPRNGSSSKNPPLLVVGETLDELRLMRQALPHDKARLAQQGLKLVPDDYALQPGEIVVVVGSEWDGTEGKVVTTANATSDGNNGINNILVSLAPDPWAEPTTVSLSHYQLAIWDYGSAILDYKDDWNKASVNAGSVSSKRRVDNLLAKIDTATNVIKKSNTIPQAMTKSKSKLSSKESINPQTTPNTPKQPQSRFTSSRARKAAAKRRKK